MLKREIMVNVKYFTLAVVAVFICSACTKDALANNANATKSPEKTAPAGPPKDALAALEKSAYAAWKSKDAKFWDTFLSDKFVGWGTYGKLDKVSAKKEYTGADCDIRSYGLSDERVSSRGKQAALITYKVTLTALAAGKRSRQTVGWPEYTFATVVNGKQSSMPKTRWSIQSCLRKRQFPKTERGETTRLSPPLWILAPAPCSR
jgi:hypothetical protein